MVSDAFRKSTKWLAANEAENIARTQSKRIGALVSEGEVDGMFITTGRHRHECWIERESFEDWITKRDAERALYMTAPEARRALGLKHDTLLKIAAAGIIRCAKGNEKLFPQTAFTSLEKTY